MPLLRNVGERSDSANSCAMPLRATSFAAASLSGSTAFSTFGNHSVRDRRSHPASASADTDAAALCEEGAARQAPPQPERPSHGMPPR